MDNAIAVPAPKTVNIDSDGAWIPLFIQGVITANFQQYSGLTVIDRQNTDMVKAEKKLGENAVYSDEDALQLGKLTHARFIITGNITKKASSYALIFNITDAETGETKAAANVPNCLASALENGEAANKISYDLMTGYGIKLSKEASAALTKSAELMKSEVQAQTSLAKGILAEKSGSNIEALTYYIQAKKKNRKLPEAGKRMQRMSSALVPTGDFIARAKNLIKLRTEWDKLITEARAYIESIQPEFELRYFSDVRERYIDYHDNTVGFDVSAPYLRQTNGNELHEARHFAEKIQSALEKTQYHANWDLNSERRLYLKGEDGRVELEFSVNLLNDKKRIISSCMVKYEVMYQLFWSYSIKASSYNYWAWNAGVPKLDFQDINVNDADSDTYYISVTPANTAAKNVSILPAPERDGEEYRIKLQGAEMDRREEYNRKHHPNLERERKQKELAQEEKLPSLLADWQELTHKVATVMNGMSHDEKCKKVESIVLKQQEKIRALQEKGKLSDEEREELKKMKKELKNMKKALRWIKRHDFGVEDKSTFWWT